MPVSRRIFLKVLAVMAVGIPASYYSLKRFPAIRNLYITITSTAMDESPTGSLDPMTLQTMLSATEALIESPVEMNHYSDFLQWRTQNIPGYKKLCEELSDILNSESMNSHNCSFTECVPAERSKIFNKLRPGSSLEKVLMGISGNRWLFFENHIFPDILKLFAMTDAWVAIGYESWPGKARGLKKYRLPPPYLSKN